MFRKLSILTATCILTFSAAAPANADTQAYHSHATEHAPIGVMGDHAHDKGEWMLSYRFMFMRMAGNRSGSEQLSASEVRGRGYPVVPTSMNMQMHMLGAMYGVSDFLTLMLMLPIVQVGMKHSAGMPLGAVKFKTKAAGLGDIRLTGLLRLINRAHHQLLLQIGVALPSGAIHVRDDTPAEANARLPYPMRLGSGSLAVLPGITYTGIASRFSWGVQATGFLPSYENQDGYRDSLQGLFTFWGAIEIAEWISSSLRTAFTWKSDISGSDADLDPALVPTADANRRGARQLDLLFGLNFIVPEGRHMAGNRFAFEFGVPVMRNLNGPQLETDWSLVAGWQKQLN